VIELLDKDYSAQYAACYDAITAHKDYVSESKAFCTILELQFGTVAVDLLSVGCGTGSHEELLDQSGVRVVGLDTSIHMIERANRKSVNHSKFIHCSVEDYVSRYSNKFHVATALFNVINCLGSIGDLRAFCSAMYATLQPNGLVYLEAWNLMPCVRSPPKIVTRHFSDEKNSYNFERVATPSFSVSRQRLEIDYRIRGHQDGFPIDLSSKHTLTLFSQLELEFALAEVGFKSICFGLSLSEATANQALMSLESTRMISISAVKT
jgi:SAM-dependent methyltransferase